MSMFNLLDEAWIPVRMHDGSRSALGIRSVLLHSREIAVLEDASPLVTAAVHRLLLAILYHALGGPTDIDQAKALFINGLPAAVISKYLDRWRDRFWLFDHAFPFFQVPGYEPRSVNRKEQWKSWTAIAAEHNGDNSKVLFDHVDVTNAGAVPTSEAARWLVACQAFVLGGGNSDFQYTKTAPSATSLMVLPLGVSLHDTLVLSLVPQNREVLKGDKPLWEREPDSVAALARGFSRSIAGYADLYTWRSRSIRLRPSENGDAVDGVLFASGVACSTEDLTDPMVGYRIDAHRGKLPIQLRDRGLWREFDSILPDNGELAPRVVEHATTLGKAAPERFPPSVIVVGQANNKAKIEYWRFERFALPGALAGDRLIRDEIARLLSDADGTSRSLWAACATVARDVLSRGERSPAPKDVRVFVEQTAVLTQYWSTLEGRFHEVLSEYTLERESDDIRHGWLMEVKEALHTAWSQYRRSLSGGDAWVIRAIAKAERSVLRELNRLKTEITELAPERELT